MHPTFFFLTSSLHTQAVFSPLRGCETLLVLHGMCSCSFPWGLQGCPAPGTAAGPLLQPINLLEPSTRMTSTVNSIPISSSKLGYNQLTKAFRTEL